MSFRLGVGSKVIDVPCGWLIGVSTISTSLVRFATWGQS
jgi:hypothetical protein